MFEYLVFILKYFKKYLLPTLSPVANPPIANFRMHDNILHKNLVGYWSVSKCQMATADQYNWQLP